MRSPQYWLAELDQHGNPTLIDGSHETAEGAKQDLPEWNKTCEQHKRN